MQEALDIASSKKKYSACGLLQIISYQGTLKAIKSLWFYTLASR